MPDTQENIDSMGYYKGLLDQIKDESILHKAFIRAEEYNKLQERIKKFKENRK